MTCDVLGVDYVPLFLRSPKCFVIVNINSEDLLAVLKPLNIEYIVLYQIKKLVVI